MPAKIKVEDAILHSLPRSCRYLRRTPPDWRKNIVINKALSGLTLVTAA